MKVLDREEHDKAIMADLAQQIENLDLIDDDAREDARDNIMTMVETLLNRLHDTEAAPSGQATLEGVLPEDILIAAKACIPAKMTWFRQETQENIARALLKEREEWRMWNERNTRSIVAHALIAPPASAARCAGRSGYDCDDGCAYPGVSPPASAEPDSAFQDGWDAHELHFAMHSEPVSGAVEAERYAERLATVLWEKHWKADSPHWKPLSGDLIGILTQIDNMTAGLVRIEPAAPREGR